MELFAPLKKLFKKSVHTILPRSNFVKPEGKTRTYLVET